MIRRQHQKEAHRRAALYVTNSQLKKLEKIHALQVQFDRSTAYNLEPGYIVSHDQLYSEVRDHPKLARLGEAVRQGYVAVVVVGSLDRHARDFSQSAILVEEFMAVGVTSETAGE